MPVQESCLHTIDAAPLEGCDLRYASAMTPDPFPAPALSMSLKLLYGLGYMPDTISANLIGVLALTLRRAGAAAAHLAAGVHLQQPPGQIWRLSHARTGRADGSTKGSVIILRHLDQTGERCHRTDLQEHQRVAMHAGGVHEPGRKTSGQHLAVFRWHDPSRAGTPPARSAIGCIHARRQSSIQSPGCHQSDSTARAHSHSTVPFFTSSTMASQPARSRSRTSAIISTVPPCSATAPDSRIAAVAAPTGSTFPALDGFSCPPRPHISTLPSYGSS